MGFDVLYLPPIHPIGRVQRKGTNNALVAEPGDVGSPWAIGAAEGGHKAILPELGTLEDFRRLVARGRARTGIEIALDIAFQCAPDHPYVKAASRVVPLAARRHASSTPRTRPRSTRTSTRSTSRARTGRRCGTSCKSVFDYWIGEGVTIFRVDNPHTKAFPFWEWAIAEIKREHPDAIFLAEAFTRPKVMHRLAKLGFTQSYTYFTWRNTKEELTEYFTELAQGPGARVLPPQRLAQHARHPARAAADGGEAAVFMARLVLAATLAASYGIYGPAFELLRAPAARARQRGVPRLREVPAAPLGPRAPDSLRPFIARVNRDPPRQPGAAGRPQPALPATSTTTS